MATLTIAIPFTSGQKNITHTLLNNAINNAVISNIVAADFAAGAVNATKLNADTAGLGITQNAVSKALDLIGYGFTTTALTNANQTLVRLTNTITQKYTGALTGAVVINVSRSGAVAGGRFRIVLGGVVVTATFTLTIQENGSGSLEVYNSALTPTVTGWLDVEFNGTSWEVTAGRVTQS